MAFGIGNSEKKHRLEGMFRAHHELIWRTLCRMGMSADSSADATQQAFLIAAERLDDIRAGCERAFVLNTALRLARSSDRKGRRCDLSEDMDIHPGRTGSRENAAQHYSSKRLLDQILVDMDPDLIATFVLFELEGMSTAEIAETLDIPPGTVASRLRRGREAFRARAARLEQMQRFDEGTREVSGTGLAARRTSRAPGGIDVADYSTAGGVPSGDSGTQPQALGQQLLGQQGSSEQDGSLNQGDAEAQKGKRSWTALLPGILGRRSSLGAAE